jgi:hypothetical protein
LQPGMTASPETSWLPFTLSPPLSGGFIES